MKQKQPTKTFYCANGHQYLAPARSCLFCRHCTDIFFDHLGPYMAFCAKGLSVTCGSEGGCPDFTPDDDKPTEGRHHE